MSEAAILEVVKKNFDDHLILGEEGGIIGDTSSDYLWCIDPLGLSFFFFYIYIYICLGNNSYMILRFILENVGVAPIKEMMIDRHKMVWS